MKNILIINQPTNNRGDEAAHRSLVRSLNTAFPNSKITTLFMYVNTEGAEQLKVVSPQNSYIQIDTFKKGSRGFFPKILMKYNLSFLAFLHPAYNKFIKKVKEADIIINAPGGICMGGFQNWAHILYLRLALNNTNEVYYYSRSIGPFPTKTKDNNLFRKRSFDLLKKMKFVSLRDSKSIKIATDIRVDFFPSIDTAFLDIPANVSIPAEINFLENDYVIFVPNSLTWHTAYKDVKQEVIDHFYLSILKKVLTIKKGYKVVMLPQLFNDPLKSDEKYFDHIKSKIDNNENIIVLPETLGSDIQQKIIANSKLVIGARYHSVVFAINNTIPFIPLSYEHKMVGLLELLGIENLTVDISKIGTVEFDEQKILEKIDNLLLYNNTLSHRISEKAHDIAKKCFNEVVKLINA